MSSANPSLAISQGAPLRLPDIGRRNSPVAPITHWQREWLKWLEHGYAFTVGLVFNHRGDVRMDALEKSLDELLRRHENLRTCYEQQPPFPGVQRVLKECAISVEVIDLSGAGEKLSEDYVRKALTDYYELPYDPGKDLPVRAYLFKLAREHHLLLLAIAHLATDSVSSAVIVKELTHLYDSHARGAVPKLSPLDLQYNDYALWLHDVLGSGDLDDSVRYWRSTLSGATPIRLPVPAAGAEAHYEMGYAVAAFKESLPRIAQLARESQSTPVSVIRAALRAVLARWTGETDIYTSSVTHGRPKPVLHSLTGLFRGYVGTRTDVSDDPPFIELVRRVHRTTVEDGRHEIAFQLLHGNGETQLPLVAEHYFIDHMANLMKSKHEVVTSKDTFNVIPYRFELRGPLTMPEQLVLRLHLSRKSLDVACFFAKSILPDSQVRLVLRSLGNALDLFTSEPHARVSAHTEVFS